MTWGFQLVLDLPAAQRFTGDTHQTWSFPDPVGNVTISAAGVTLEDASEFTFRGTAFASHDEAHDAGKMFCDWIRIAGVLEGWGFDLGKGVIRSGVSEDVKARVLEATAEHGVYLVEDVHGLTVFEETGEHPLRLAMRIKSAASGMTIQRPSEHLRDSIVRCARTKSLTEKQTLVCELLLLADREASARAQLITAVTAMEVLAERSDRTGLAGVFVHKFITLVEKRRKLSIEKGDQRELDSLLGGLQDLRKTSISTSVREVAGRSRPEDPNAAKLAKDIYKCRSDLVHDGKSKLESGTISNDARSLARDMFRFSLSE